ncbi:MAG: sulfotransferase [Acidobacteriota bacterium]|nr:sulfotransferase domain-containing protein [Blastocatellia bacterium]MDW8411051.1 sulfotransferase [Acidobacteriota bacterium]
MQAAPVAVKRHLFRELTSRLRVLPDFLVIGVQKAGTTSLFNYLIEHPGILPTVRKQMHYFDNRYERGEDWYRSHFPMELQLRYRERRLGYKCLTGEATPYYIFHPHAPRRIRSLLPKAKLIVLLRNPVDRAYSHYNHEVRKGAEKLSFEEAIEKEAERLRPELERMLQDEHYYSFAYQHYSYLARGRYAEQLSYWFKLFPKEQFLILKSEDFDRNIPETLNKIYRFLGLPELPPKNYPYHNRGNYPQMSSETRQKLREYFRRYNEQLYELLQIDFGWDVT